MKKLLILLVAMLALTVSACSPSDGDTDNGERTYEIALITDVGTIDDKSFNQGSWEGVVEFAEENNKTYKYYKPLEKDKQQYLNSIKLAVDNGAKVVVTPGFLFETAVYEAQTLYPEVSFILLDGYPHVSDDDYTVAIEDNVHSIFYAEEQVGFLAGYAAVKDGYRSLGFMGGMAVPAVIKFGYGFVAGAEYAAKELNEEVTMQYTYLGDFGPSPAHQTRAAAWYTSGVEVIFAAAGGAGNSVMAAAKDSDGKVIGVDVDQSAESETVITSAMKSLGLSVYNSLKDFYAGEFKGGVIETLGVLVEGVGLPMDSSKFENFTQADYEAIYAELVADTNGLRSNLPTNETVDSADKIETEFVTVTVTE